MGCLPTKVNTQTTHSCPSLKHAHTLTSTRTLNVHTCYSLPVFGIFICQDFRFLENKHFYLLSFFFVWFGRSRSSCFWFPLLTFLRAYFCSYIPALSFTSRIQSSEDICTSFCLNLHAFSRNVVLSSTCHLKGPDNHSQRQIWSIQVGWVILILVKATLWQHQGLGALMKSAPVDPPISELNNLAQDRLLVQLSTLLLPETNFRRPHSTCMNDSEHKYYHVLSYVLSFCSLTCLIINKRISIKLYLLCVNI